MPRSTFGVGFFAFDLSTTAFAIGVSLATFTNSLTILLVKLSRQGRLALVTAEAIWMVVRAFHAKTSTDNLF